MALSSKTTLLLLAVLGLGCVAGEGPPRGAYHWCYDCGYKCAEHGDDPRLCIPEPINDNITFCGDETSIEDTRTKCTHAGECCGSLKTYFTNTNADGSETVSMVAYHGCEQTLTDALHVEFEVMCEGHANACYNISRDAIQDDEMIQAEACFCDTDLCNKDVPYFPDPTDPPTAGPTDPPTFKTCYDCGYRCTDIVDNVCKPEPISPMLNFCGDAADMESKTKKCTGGDECCGSLKEYFVKINDDGSSKTDMIAYHGCEADMAGALGAQFGVVCDGHTDACYNVSREEIADEMATFAEACFCDGDLCNRNLPNLPDPAPSPGQETTTPCPECRECYSCGYQKTGQDGESTTLPDLAFCSDFTTASDITATCSLGDCCGSLKEYIIMTDETTGENRTHIIGRHGCASEIDHLSHFSVTCEDNGESCFQVDEGELDHDGHDGTVVKAEICLCDRDRCNNDDPIPDIPTTTPDPENGTGGSAGTTASAVVLLVGLALFH